MLQIHTHTHKPLLYHSLNCRPERLKFTEISEWRLQYVHGLAVNGYWIEKYCISRVSNGPTGPTLDTTDFSMSCTIVRGSTSEVVDNHVAKIPQLQYQYNIIDWQIHHNNGQVVHRWSQKWHNSIKHHRVMQKGTKPLTLSSRSLFQVICNYQISPHTHVWKAQKCI